METWLTLEWSKEFLQISTVMLIAGFFGIIVYSYRPGDFLLSLYLGPICISPICRPY